MYVHLLDEHMGCVGHPSFISSKVFMYRKVCMGATTLGKKWMLVFFLCYHPDIRDGPNTVSESTVSNTELSEFLCPHRVPGRELSEFLSAYYLCATVNSPSFSPKSPSLPQNSVSSLFRNSTLETVFGPLAKTTAHPRASIYKKLAQTLSGCFLLVLEGHGSPENCFHKVLLIVSGG